MGRERKCILCELVCSSKQEMDDHMRTMLHHRELEKLKGRDCGHDCTVCRVSMVSLTDYASHISSKQHKVNVEASERCTAVAGAHDGEEMDYFDQALVDLIEKRKEMIRNEEEAAAVAEARRAAEESERRRQQEFLARLHESKEGFRLNLQSRKPPRGYGAPRGPGTVLGWGSDAKDQRIPDQASWTNGRQEKSATWHAPAPSPGFQGAAGGQWASGSLGSGSKGFGGDPFGQGAPRGRHPWLSNQGSSHGLYGRNNIRPHHLMGPPFSLGPLCGLTRSSPAGLFSPKTPCDSDLGLGGAGECHRGNEPGPKSHGPPGCKLDRACRWAPYPPAAKAPEKMTPPPPMPVPPDVPRRFPDTAAVPRQHETAGAGLARPGPVQREERPGRAGAAAGDRKKMKPPKTDADRKRSSNGGQQNSSSTQQEAHSRSSTQQEAHSRSSTQQEAHSRSSTQQEVHSRSSTQQEAHSRSSTQQEAHSRSSTQLEAHSRSSTQPEAHSRSSTQLEAHSRSSTQLEAHSRSSTQLEAHSRSSSAAQKEAHSRSSSAAQRDGQSACSSGPSKPPPDGRKLVPKDRKSSLTPSSSDNPTSRPPAQEKKQQQQQQPPHKPPKPPSKTASSRASPAAPLQSRQEQQIPDQSGGAGPERRGSEGGVPSERRKETPPPPSPAPSSAEEAQPQVSPESREGANKENKCRKGGPKDPLPDLVRPGPRGATRTYPDCSEYLQSVHISTSSSSSTLETPAPVISSTQEESSAPKAPQNPSGLTRLGLPPVLSKHMGAKGGKAAAHEPNLHGARRVRHIGGSGGGNSGEKESGLKPTVRQLISASGSRRNVNWDQVYQEIRKKQGQGKGWPRFGIEMVSCDQEDPAQEEDHDMALLEGFHWDSLLDSTPCVAPRKRSLSESSVAPTRPAPSLGLFSCQVSGEQGGPAQTTPPSPEEQGTEEDTVFSDPGAGEPARGIKEEPGQPDQNPMEVGAPTPVEVVKKGRGGVALQRAESVEVCGPGAELLDAQAMGKKRRAAGDISNPEIHSLKKNKRMKIKSKKERFQVDQLLAMSLREEELSLSLQTLNTDLIQARVTLQAAYMEVQRIMVQSQQVSTEMATMRNQRIELLKVMQGVLEEPASPPQVKQESGGFDSPASAATAGDVSIPLTGPPPPPAPSLLPRPGTPDNPAVVKQEPLSPLTTSLPDTVKLQWSPDGGPVADQPSAQPQRVPAPPAPCKDSLPAAANPTLDCKLVPEPFTSPRNHGNTSIRSDESGSTAPELPPASTASPEMRNNVAAKRVRRLRKRRVLNKVQGAEPAEQAAAAATSEDDDEDSTAAKPRRLRPRRRSSAGSMVSTSTLPTGPEDEECGAVEEEKEEEETPGPPAREEEEFDSALEMVEIGKEEANVDLSEPEEEAMEVTAAPASGLAPGPGPCLGLGPAPDSSRSGSLNLADNEVTSTSDMDISAGVPPYTSDGQTPLPLAKDIKTKLSSDVSSDPGDDEVPTEGPFEGHKEAVNGLQIHRGLLYTCSGDRTVKAFDLVTHECVAVFKGHLSKVNCVLVSAVVGLPHRLYSGSSDQTVRCYSLKTRLLEQQFSLPHRVLCLHSRWKVLYAGLANGTVATFNLKTNRPMEVFECHGPRAVSCLTSAQEGARKVLLVGSYDSTISVRDARNGLLLRTLEGHVKTVLCMKVVNDLVFSGSSDHSVHAHNIHTGELVRVYKGHSHAVSVVAILGKVMLTASLDKLVRVYELQSHDRLQVYGGHMDMVMCMTVHKSMIYTGCYDGSVQAVKLNLLQNYRCMWHGCSLIFGVLEHLQQHLEDAHANPSFQTLKCRWRNCDELFCARDGSKQGITEHMQKHVDELVTSDT